MNTRLTVIMYHYVRDVKNTAFPEIKARNIKEFENQVRYVCKHYNIISIDELLSAINHNEQLPPNPALLTFDDGYVDHYTNVLPLLIKYNISGCFYPSGRAIDDKIVLDVNKIHFILASVKDLRLLKSELFRLMDEYRNEYNLESNENYYNALHKPNAYDCGNIIFIKRLLQRELPVDLRVKIVGSLFEKYVTSDERGFSEVLYMNKEQLSEMLNYKMHIGSHGYDHNWLDTLSENEQKNEIIKSLAFLKHIGVQRDLWTICYPYGSYASETLHIVTKLGGQIGFVVQGKKADLSMHNRLLLPRLDTNQLPVK